MKLTVDTDKKVLIRDEKGQKSEMPLYSKEAFEELRLA
jgi:hypothetical protein